MLQLQLPTFKLNQARFNIFAGCQLGQNRKIRMRSDIGQRP